MNHSGLQIIEERQPSTYNFKTVYLYKKCVLYIGFDYVFILLKYM